MSDANEAESEESIPEIQARIIRKFAALEKVTHGIANRKIRGAIVAGAPGIGKTFSMSRILGEAAEMGDIKYESVTGAMSGISMFQKLWDKKDPDGVILIDDCDGVFEDSDSLNLLKGALDTSAKRMISWSKESKVLEGAGIPNKFEFQGSVAFITNVNFKREIRKQSKMAKHYAALMDRCTYVDLGIHTRKEIFVRIKQVVESEQFLKTNRLSATAAKQMLAWIMANKEKLHTMSIRTVLQLIGFVHTDEGNWKDMAEELLY
jgi:hypothetical protein